MGSLLAGQGRAMTDKGEPTEAPQGRPAGPGAEAMTAERQIGDRPPPDPDAPARGVLDEDEADPPEANEPA
jgi:hypothetical protein